MNPSKKGWLSHLLHTKFLEEINVIENRSLSNEQQLYQLLQPTGLMYGHPSKPLSISPLNDFHDLEQSKVVFTQGLFRVFQLFFTDKPHKYDDKRGFCLELLKFYYGVYPNVFRKKKDLLSLSINELITETEYIIDKRMKIGVSSYDAFWSSFFQNSLLYLDVILFSLFNGAHDPKYVIDLKSEANTVVLKIIALAAGTDGVIESEERKLFKFFF